MMRNVAIGAVLGFGLVVLFLSIFNTEPPPPAPPPAPAAAPPAPAPAAEAAAAPPAAAPAAPAVAEAAANDGGPATALVPLNTAPVVVTPNIRANIDDRRLLMMQMMREQRAAMIIAGDAGAPAP
jgi:hypothetical protein